MIRRRKTRVIGIGNIKIGGRFPIAIQAMAKTHTKDIKNTIEELKRLENCGAEILRLAIKDSEDASAIKAIRKKIKSLCLILLLLGQRRRIYI